MSEVKADLLYSEEHEWAAKGASRTVRIGITDFAQSRLGDIVFVELPEVGAKAAAGDSLGTIESVKTVSDLYSPVGGTVTKRNETLIDQPELVNTDPYGEGWIVELEVDGEPDDALSELLTPEKYEELIADQA
ncbi:glycine cleavage system protein GcvH [Gorillibacterium timonense]|uniref:glycine cleavage system protein GcvH n=1 Tax=Gorillibacterium timonense TaxID=1689269 RepID=UPI00071C437E|nr:glycine cleavage system protein GcvH [Gorillibacterium timonense]